MKTINCLTFVVFASLFSIAPLARADLVQGTDPAFGANSLTIDTSTGLSWLNLNYTVGLSYNQVRADMQPGGLFSGYQFATAPQVVALFNDAGIPANNYYSLSTPSIQSFFSLMGTTFVRGQPGLFANSGTLIPDAIGAAQEAPGIYELAQNGVQEYFVTDGSNKMVYRTDSSPGVANWLVAVPEPGFYAIAGVGLTAFIFIRRIRIPICIPPKSFGKK